MYLNSKHMQVALLLKKSEIDDYKILSKMLNFTPSSFFSYLREIESVVLNKNETDIKILMNDIRNTKNLLYLIKKKQHITKDERISYIIFKLLKDRLINITKLSEELNVTRRTLNYDLETIKTKLSIYKIDLIPYKNIGLTIFGKEISIRRMFLGYIIKFFIEKNFLPKLIRDEFANFLKQSNYKSLSKNISNLDIEDNDSFYYNELVLISAGLAFSYLEENLETTSIKINDNFSLNIVDCCVNYFNDLLQKRCYIHEEFSSQLNEYLKHFEKVIAIFFNFKIDDNIYKILPIKKWLVFLYVKDVFDIKDLYFINILKNELPSKVNLLANKLKVKIPKVSLYDSFIIYFFISNLIDTEIISLKENAIFVYKNIPTSLVENIVKKIEKVYAVEITKTVRFKNINFYLKNNYVSTVYSLENFDLTKSHVKHIKLSISDFLMS